MEDEMYKIGFSTDTENTATTIIEEMPKENDTMPRRSVVDVYFVEKNKTLAYYNDIYDLHVGDLVYVEGSMEGYIGKVRDVRYSFKINLSEYKRVISLVDTTVHGVFSGAVSHLVTFDRKALPKEKARTWFLPPEKEDNVYVTGDAEDEFLLDEMGEENFEKQIAQRGHEYYLQSKVQYLCLDGIHGYAIVCGTHPYEVEFDFKDGVISNLGCTCFCSYNCKHEFATMLQLHETLGIISECFANDYEKNGYFAAIEKNTFITCAVAEKPNVSIVL